MTAIARQNSSGVMSSSMTMMDGVSELWVDPVESVPVSVSVAALYMSWMSRAMARDSRKNVATADRYSARRCGCHSLSGDNIVGGVLELPSPAVTPGA
jgi:hypothetical protein